MDAFVNNNGYLTTEVDGDIANEIQTLSINGQDLSISSGNTITLPAGTDNLGNHTATQNIELNGNYLSGDGGNEGVFVDSLGKVGIGTTTPKQKLHVGGDYYGKGHIWLHANEGDGSSGTVYVQARDDSGTSTINMQLRTQNAGNILDAMTLKADGKVGINNTSPTTMLDVNGTVTATGFAGDGSGLTNINVDDADANPTNEIQTLSINGQDLSISSGNTITIPSGLDNLGNHTATQALDLSSNDITGVNTATVEKLEFPTDAIKIGSNALSQSTVNFNVAVGTNALNANTTGITNTAIGNFSLQTNTTGGANTALGRHALAGNTTGAENTAIGNLSSFTNTTGSFNTAVGFQSLTSNSGSSVTGIGYKAGVLAANLTNATAIGANAKVDASNKIRLGDDNVTLVETKGKVLASGLEIQQSGKIGINTSTPRSALDLAPSSGQGDIFGVDRIVGKDDLRFFADNVGGVEAMRIEGNNNVNIMNGNLALTGSWLSNDGDNEGLKITNEGRIAIGNNNYISADGDNEGIRIANNGNVGVGGVNPSAHFSIKGSNNNSHLLLIDIDNNGSDEWFIEDDGKFRMSTPTSVGNAFGIDANGDIYASLHANTTVTPVNVVLDLSNKLRYAVSSRKYKKNIAPVTLDVDKYLTLQTKKWQFKKQDPREKDAWDYGFIAEEVDSLNLDLPLSIRIKGEVESLRYFNFAFYNFTAIKQHRERIVALEDRLGDAMAKIEERDAKIESLEQRLTQIEAMLNMPNKTMSNSEK